MGTVMEKLQLVENLVNLVIVSIKSIMQLSTAMKVLPCFKLSFLTTAPSSSQWYAWGPSHMQCKLCHNCWQYWKKYGGLKVPSRIG